MPRDSTTVPLPDVPGRSALGPKHVGDAARSIVDHVADLAIRNAEARGDHATAKRLRATLREKWEARNAT